MCLCLLHKNFEIIQDKVRQAFRLPLDQIIYDPMDELALFSSCCPVGVYAILEKVIHVNDRFLLAS